MAATERTSLLPRAAAGPGRGPRLDAVGGIADLNREYDDPPERLTLGRRVAGNLSRFAWYRPPGGGGEGLAAAWAYFEHFVLPRHFVRHDSGGGGGGAWAKDERQLAEPGESERATQLYDVWRTPEKDLADMGVGVGSYFFTLRCLVVVLLVAGLLNVPVLWHYSSLEYNLDGEEGVPYVLRASAICTDHTWAACPSCTREQWDYFPRSLDRYAEAANGDQEGPLTFIKVNHCRLGYVPGLCIWTSLVFVSLAMYWICVQAVTRREQDFDEAEQTSADYSVAVADPPGDARDAGRWRDFFTQFGHVTTLTVALGNEDLVRALVERRGLLHQLEALLPPGAELDKFNPGVAAKLARPVPWWQEVVGLCYGGPKLLDKMAELDKAIAEMVEKKYDVAQVFVTFETEAAQRRALSELRVGRLDAMTNRKRALPERLMYEGKHVLSVLEAPEPSAVRWQDLGDSLARRLAIRFVTASMLAALILCGGIVIYRVRLAYGPAAAALAISALNTAAPQACYVLTDMESHRSEGAKQAWRYIKMSFAMLFFSTLVTAYVTPFADTTSNAPDAILRSVLAIFLVDELITGPLSQILDPEGNLKRHLLGPRATNHLELAALFKGTVYDLSERYTNMTNVLFLTFYYATIFPAGYFFAALVLTCHYWIDKYCLLRVWAQAPKIGTAISPFGKSFIIASLLVLVVLSSYYVASFPFDNACKGSESVPPEYVGEFTATTGDDLEVSVSIKKDDQPFFFCNMDMQRYVPVPAFPAWASNQPPGGEWMDRDQERLTWLFGWTSVLGVACCVWIFFRRVVLKFLRIAFFGGYRAEGTPSEATFSEVLEESEIFAYVPQVRVPNLPMPVLVCNVDDISRGLIGWNDPHNEVSVHNVLLDIPGLDQKKVFSEVYHWPPPGKE